VLADFRDSMLYALLCSIALRPVKDWLVAQLDASLADTRRSVGGALLVLAALPLTVLVDAWEEGRTILSKWRQTVQEEIQRRQAALLKRASEAGVGGAAATPTSPRTPRTAAAAAAAGAPGPRTPAAMRTMPSLAVYGQAAVKVLKSRWGRSVGAPVRVACRLQGASISPPSSSARLPACTRMTSACAPLPLAGAPARRSGSSGRRRGAHPRPAACSSDGCSAAAPRGWPGSGCG
jgi:hypothetical protein